MSPCKKAAYASKALAKRAAKRTYSGHRLTVYECSRCGAWHRTKVVNARRWR